MDAHRTIKSVKAEKMSKKKIFYELQKKRNLRGCFKAKVYIHYQHLFLDSLYEQVFTPS